MGLKRPKKNEVPPVRHNVGVATRLSAFGTGYSLVEQYDEHGKLVALKKVMHS